MCAGSSADERLLMASATRHPSSTGSRAGGTECLQAEATGACALFLVMLVSVMSVMAVMALLTMMARLAMMTMRPFGFGALVGHGR